MNYEIVAGGLRFPEGPVWMLDGSVIVVEIAAGRLTGIEPDGSKETIATAASPQGCHWGRSRGAPRTGQSPANPRQDWRVLEDSNL